MEILTSNVSYSNDVLNTEKSTIQKKCRICLEFDEIENLIYPCNCTGSMKYVH